MRLLSFILCAIWVFTAHSQTNLSGNIGSSLQIDAPTSPNSSWPHLYSVSWSKYSGDDCVTLSGAYSTPVTVHIMEKGKVRILCHCEYYNKNDNSKGKIYRNYYYDITCIDPNSGGGGSDDSGGGDTGGGSDTSEGYFYDYTEEGHYMLFYKAYYYGDCAKVIKTQDDRACISSTTTGKVTVPNVAKDYPVRIIGNWAFSNLPNITDIVLPQSTSDIEDYSIYNCPNLKTITCLSENPPSCYSTSFQGCEKMILYVKSKSAKEKYAAAEGWKWFKMIKVIGEEDDISVTSINLNTTSATLTVGETQQLTATISPSNATNKSVTWSTSNSSVATVSSSGLVTAKGEGSATITCKADDGSGKYATCSITVKNSVVYVTSISLSASSATLEVGDTKQLTATVSPSNATNKSVTWSTSKSSVATVSSSGLVTAKGEGSATITCKADDGSGKYATCSITVKNSVVYVTSISLNASSATLEVGDSKQLTATVSPSNASNKSVTWSTSKSSVATVSSSGLVTAKGEGSATITCKADDGSGKYATCSITVKAVSEEGIKIDESNFPDEAFRKYLQEQDYGKDGILTEEEIKNVTSIDVHYTYKVPFGGSSSGDKKGNVESLKGIEFFTNLETLLCYSNVINSLDVSKCPKLTSLSCSNNNLSTLDVTKCTALTSLSCSNNNLSALDVTKCTALTSLSCSDNNLSTLDVTKCTALTSLSCSDNKLSALDVKKCTALTSLSCDDNQLSALDVTKCTALTSLSCSDNKISALDVTRCSTLTTVNCSVNVLTSLDVTQCQSIKTLKCGGNSLSTLDMSKCPALTTLECNENKLSSINLQDNASLDYINCSHNHLSSLDISQCVALDYLNCSNNQIGEKEMASVINGLPQRTPHKERVSDYEFVYVIYPFRVIDNTNTEEKNVCSQAQVASLKEKGWEPQYYDGTDWNEYVGSESTGIHGVIIIKNGSSSIYNLSGQRLSTSQKGINIINGKKVIIK